MDAAGNRSAGAASNQYQILGHLATGGMAELFLARAVGIAGFERYVVLKRIMAEQARNHRFVTMFLDEARLAAQLHHPNIAQVYDIGRVSDSYFFTMEYVHGENVRDVLQRVAALKRQIPVEVTLTVIAGAAAGLHYAHDKRGINRQPLGIVHRDVSPSNLMVAYEGAVKLVDFGIAKATDRMTETRSGAVKGKVAYMSPEQCTGNPLDRRSDIFSLGIVLYEMATMTRLFKHPTDFETMNHIVNHPIPPPTSRRPELPRELEQIILRALAKKPDDRFQTAGELLEAIEQFASRERLALSNMGLARYVRELFGERPEPWYELEAAGEATGLVTIETAAVAPGAMTQPDPFSPVSTQRSWSGARTTAREWQNSGPVTVPPPVVPSPAGSAAPSPPPPSTAGAAPTPPRPPPPAPPPHPTLAGYAPPSGTGLAARLPLAPAPTTGSGEVARETGTVIGAPETAPLVVTPPAVTRDTPDHDPSWTGERDPSWQGREPVIDDAAPGRRRWVVWATLAVVVLVGVVIIIGNGGGTTAAQLPSPSIQAPPPASAPAAPTMAVPASPPTDPPPTDPLSTVPPPAPVPDHGAAAVIPNADRGLPAPASGARRGGGKKGGRSSGATTVTKPDTRPPPPPKKCGDALGLYPPCE